MPAYTPDDWRRVADAINERMASLGLTQTDLVRRSEVSDLTIRPLQYGEPVHEPRDATLAKIAKALGWRHDAIRRLLEDPDVNPDELTVTHELVKQLLDDNRRERLQTATYDERIRRLPPSARRMIDTVLEVAEAEVDATDKAGLG